MTVSIIVTDIFEVYQDGHDLSLTRALSSIWRA